MRIFLNVILFKYLIIKIHMHKSVNNELEEDKLGNIILCFWTIRCPFLLSN